MSIPATNRDELNNRPYFEGLIRAKIGDQIWALQRGLVEGGTDPEPGKAVNAGFGFNPGALAAGAANLGEVTTTTSGTAGTVTTVNYDVPNAPAAWNGHAWVEHGDGYVTAKPTYSAGILTISVGSRGVSQNLTILIWNG